MIHRDNKNNSQLIRSWNMNCDYFSCDKTQNILSVSKYFFAHSIDIKRVIYYFYSANSNKHQWWTREQKMLRRKLDGKQKFWLCKVFRFIFMKIEIQAENITLRTFFDGCSTFFKKKWPRKWLQELLCKFSFYYHD